MPLLTAPSRSTVREVLDAGHLRAAVRPSRADATLAASLRCGCAVAVALVACAVVGRTDLAGFAALGALTSLYGRYEPYRRRGALLVVVGVALVLAVAVTTASVALGAPDVVTLAVVALVAAGMTALCQALRTGPPGATIVVFAAGAGMAGSPALADLGPRMAAGTFGAVAAFLVCCSAYIWWPWGPARIAVRRAAAATDRALADPSARDAAQAAVTRARDVLADDASHRRTRAHALALGMELQMLEPAHPGPGHAGLPPRRTLRATARTAPPRTWRLPAARVAAGSVVAATVAQVVGWGHPAWASMGATATLQGATTGDAVIRAVQRAGGTALGALIAWPLLGAHLGFWQTAAAVVILQVVTEIVVGRNYGAAMLTITPMALLMTSLGGPAAPGSLALDRALDTALGGVVAVAVLVLLRGRPRSGR